MGKEDSGKGIACKTGSTLIFYPMLFLRTDFYELTLHLNLSSWIKQ